MIAGAGEEVKPADTTDVLADLEAARKTIGTLCIYHCGHCGKPIPTGCYCSKDCADADT